MTQRSTISKIFRFFANHNSNPKHLRLRSIPMSIERFMLAQIIEGPVDYMYM
jgi:hypothetical protein